MNAGEITAVVSGLLALGSGFAWLVKRHDARKDPIPKSQAEVALAQQALGVVKESRDTLVQDVQRLKADRAEDRARLDDQQDQLTALHRDNADLHVQVDQFKRLLSHATRFIETMLRWVRAGSEGPQPTLPAPLIDLIDPTLRN